VADEAIDGSILELKGQGILDGRFAGQHCKYEGTIDSDYLEKPSESSTNFMLQPCAKGNRWAGSACCSRSTSDPAENLMLP
jgi:hypothetical protein